MTIDEVNALEPEAFLVRFGGIFERSPWVAEAVVDQRPFASRDAMVAAMVSAVDAADDAAKLALLRAHPELAGRAAIRGELTEDSTREQSSAGLDRCSPEEFARLHALNAAYNERFGFPFIVAVRGLDRAGILERFEARLGNEVAAEWDEALRQVARIAGLRLADVIQL